MVLSGTVHGFALMLKITGAGFIDHLKSHPLNPELKPSRSTIKSKYLTESALH